MKVVVPAGAGYLRRDSRLGLGLQREVEAGDDAVAAAAAGADVVLVAQRRQDVIDEMRGLDGRYWWKRLRRGGERGCRLRAGDVTQTDQGVEHLRLPRTGCLRMLDGVERAG